MTAGSPERIAVVTGGGAGIGRAVCELLAATGLHVIVADRDPGASEDAVAAIRGSSESARVDVTDTASVEALMRDLGARFAELHALVNCAGVARPAPSHELTDEDFIDLLGIHLHGTLRCCRAGSQCSHLALPQYSIVASMKRRWIIVTTKMTRASTDA